MQSGSRLHRRVSGSRGRNKRRVRRRTSPKQAATLWRWLHVWGVPRHVLIWDIWDSIRTYLAPSRRETTPLTRPRLKGGTEIDCMSGRLSPCGHSECSVRAAPGRSAAPHIIHPRPGRPPIRPPTAASNFSNGSLASGRARPLPRAEGEKGGRKHAAISTLPGGIRRQIASTARQRDATCRPPRFARDASTRPRPYTK